MVHLNNGAIESDEPTGDNSDRERQFSAEEHHSAHWLVTTQAQAHLSVW